MHLFFNWAAQWGPATTYGFLFFLTRAPGASGGPRKVPLGYPGAFPGPPGASRRPPGPKTNQQKLRNLKEVAESWNQLDPPSSLIFSV